MKVLFVGGTGLISSACTRLAAERGLELFLLNRGGRPERAGGATVLVADHHDEAAAERALAGREFDVVVDWIAYTPDDIERDPLRIGDHPGFRAAAPGASAPRAA